MLGEEEARTWNDWLVETMQALGVVYRSGFAPPNAIVAPVTSTSLEGEAVMSTIEGEAVETTTTVVGE